MSAKTPLPLSGKPVSGSDDIFFQNDYKNTRQI